MGAIRSNAELLGALDTALKSITDISQMGDAILSPAKFAQFVRKMEDRTVILPESRFIGMDAQQVDIDRTGFIGRVLRSGSANDGSSRTLGTGEFATVSTQTNKLIAKELQAVTSLRDRALRRNIEGGNFEGTLVDLFGEAAGRDMEEFALLADSGRTFAADDVLSQTDGWLKLAANRIYGGSGGAFDYDPEDAEKDNPEVIFQALLEALPKKFLGNTSDWRIYVPWGLFDSYHDVLKKRNTTLGDQAQQSSFPRLPWKGMWVVYAPLLERIVPAQDAVGETANEDHEVWGQVAALQNPDNMAWGVYHEVTVEDEREAKERRTDFVLTMEADAHYEDENAAVVAFISQDDPT